MGLVRNLTGMSIFAGMMLAWTALGAGVVDPATRQAAAELGWWIVVLTTSAPLIAFLTREQPLTGPLGGLLNGTATGIGLVLLLTGRAF